MKSGDLSPKDVLEALYKYTVKLASEHFEVRDWSGITHIVTKSGNDTYTVESAFGSSKFTNNDVEYVFVPANCELIKFYLKDGSVVNLELVRITKFNDVNMKIREILPD